MSGYLVTLKKWLTLWHEMSEIFYSLGYAKNVFIIKNVVRKNK